MAQELSLDQIKALTQQNRDVEAEYRNLRIERERRDKEENTRHSVALGEINRWFNLEVEKLNNKIRELNEASKGLMPVNPRR